MFNGTSFMNNALTLDEARSQYWSEPTEIFARLFECWVTDQLADFWFMAQKNQRKVGI